jgi:hypothetical protein
VSSASESSYTSGELMMRPRRRPGDLVEVAPGLISVQHAGGGKSNQYFLRGFDIDHGTDLALFVDQMPVNMPSHGHGQGYADLHFVIPETIARIDVHKGPYYAQFGDFATAGALQMKTMDRAPENLAAFRVGQYGVLRGLGLGSIDVTDRTGIFLAGEIYAQDGPFENEEDLQRFNAFGKVRHDFSPSTTLTATWMSYAGTWNASGQIPLRAVESGQIDRFGTIDPSEGGSTQRHSASLRLSSQFDDWSLEATFYGIRYDFRLYSNFTFYLDDPLRGDEIEQIDARNIIGTDMHVHGRKVYDWATLETTAGIQVRSDHIENGLYHDQSRERLDTRADARIAQTSIGFYLEEKAQFFPWLTIDSGLRFDRMQVSDVDHLDDLSSTGNQSGGDAAAMLVSPKVSLILSPLDWLDMYVNFGRGFHSNDARGATRSQDPVDLLVPANGYEVGTRVRPLQALELTAAAYRLDLDSEQVYIGDEGTTEPSDRSTRYGVEFTGTLHLGHYLNADAAVTLNRAEYRPNEGNGGSVALAPTRTVSAGISGRTSFGTFGALRLRSIGARPATEDGSIEAEGWTVLSASVGHRQGPFELRLDVDNLLNSSWREVQFATTSQLQNESTPTTEIHFAPGWPLTAMGTLTAYF